MLLWLVGAVVLAFWMVGMIADGLLVSWARCLELSGCGTVVFRLAVGGALGIVPGSRRIHLRQAFSGALFAPENVRQPMIDLIQVAGVRGGCPAVTHDRTLM
ncbi:hypothetical protein, partial [Bifidobacterium sp. M0307]